jgi:hypothetical protein
MSERNWYADWRVWLCMALLALGALVQSLVGLPFRLLDAIRNILFG